MGVGGGLSMFFLVSTILGLFGSDSIPERSESTPRTFSITLIFPFDVNAILEGGSFGWFADIALDRAPLPIARHTHL